MQRLEVKLDVALLGHFQRVLHGVRDFREERLHRLRRQLHDERIGIQRVVAQYGLKERYQRSPRVLFRPRLILQSIFLFLT